MSARIVLYSLPLAIVILSIVGCGPRDSGADGQATSLAILLNWFPDAQHGGFYAAAESGAFEAEGLSGARIIPGGPGSPVIQNISLGKHDFGIANADQILLARAQGADVVALMSIMQTSPRCIMVHQRSGIESLQQLRDVKLAVGAGKAFAKFMQKRLPLTGVTMVNYTGSVAPFLADPQLAQQAYVFSEPRLVAQNGTEATTLMVSELGFDPYNTCLITRAGLITERPEEVARVVRAVRKGWLEYFSNPAPSHARILADNPQMDEASLQFGAAAIQPLCLPAGMNPDEFGRMERSRWETLAEQLVEIELLSEPLDVAAAFTNEFLSPEVSTTGP